MDIILFAVPFFFLLIGIELLAEKVRGTSYYRVNDALTSLTTGMLNQAYTLLKLLFPFTLYVWVYQQFAFFQVGQEWWVWLIAFVFYDLCYYWNHRLGHEMNLLWAAHVVHHNSEDYNLSTALRQTSTSFLSPVFYLPMALLGFDPIMVLTVGALNLVYQFWVHTQHIGKMGWFDTVFVSPSNHRVHHGQNSLYVDRNYGGVFILWDRLFGSFQMEMDDDPPIFGIRGALNSWNPLWANLQFYHQLWSDCLHTRNWWHKFSLWFRRTGWRPPDVVARYPLVKTDLANFNKFDTQVSLLTKCYASLQYLLMSGLVLCLMLQFEVLPERQVLWVIAVVFVGSYGVGALMQGLRAARWFELLKLIVIAATLVRLDLPSAMLVGLAGLLLGSAALWPWVQPGQISYRDNSQLKNSVA